MISKKTKTVQQHKNKEQSTIISILQSQSVFPDENDSSDYDSAAERASLFVCVGVGWVGGFADDTADNLFTQS